MLDPLRLQSAAGPQVYQEMFGEQDLKRLHRLHTDFRYFAARCLWVVNKAGNLVRFVFNEAQEYFHMKVEDMLARLGYVRMIVLKGRQQGLSTYIVARSYWIALTRPHKTICIMAHDDKTTGILFKKVEIFAENTPEPLKPVPEEDNKYAYKFPNKSNFYVVTAGSGNSGRGTTAQVQHQSERGLYKDVAGIDSGVGEAIADGVPGTEQYYESTAFGFNHFQKEYTNARTGIGVFECCFIPWYWQKEYWTEPAKDFSRTDEEERIAMWYGLNDGQLQWRRNKIVKLDDIKLFKREYPLNDMEAFQASGDTFYNSDLIMAARRCKRRGRGPVIIGCDPAGSGDRTVVVARQGCEIIYWKVYKTMTGERLQKILSDLIDELDAVKCFIDAGYGHDVISALRNSRYKKIVTGVHFNSQPFDPTRFKNKRAEMYYSLRDWLKDDANIPDDDDIAQDLSAIPEPDPSKFPFQFPPKKQIKKDFGRSPDIVDAMMLTFAMPVREKDFDNQGGMREDDGRSVQRSSKPTNAAEYRQRKYGSRRYSAAA